MTATSGSLHFEITGSCDEVQAVARKLLEIYHSLKLPDEKVTALRLAYDEAINNAVQHGNCGDCSLAVNIGCNWTPEAVTITVADQGPGFNCRKIPNPTIKENLLKESGRGLYLINELMSKVDFNETGNEIRMTLQLNG